jgi:hypothetical protein
MMSWPKRSARRRGFVRGLVQPLQDAFLVDALFLRPILDRQVEIEIFANVGAQALHVPLLGIGLFRDAAGDHVLDDILAHLGDGLRDVLAFHQLDALLEDDLALVVHHVVELEQVLADVEVARLDLLLRLFQCLVDPGMDDRLALLEAELLQHAVHAVGAEDAHQVVLQRQEEL